MEKFSFQKFGSFGKFKTSFFHNKKPIDAETGVSLGKLANDLIAELDGKLYEGENSSKEYLLRADQLLIELGCEQQAYRNRLTLKGFEQRLSILGTKINSHLQKPTPDSMKACEMALEKVKEHKRAKNSNKILLNDIGKLPKNA